MQRWQMPCHSSPWAIETAELPHGGRDPAATSAGPGGNAAMTRTPTMKRMRRCLRGTPGTRTSKMTTMTRRKVGAFL